MFAESSREKVTLHWRNVRVLAVGLVALHRKETATVAEGPQSLLQDRALLLGDLYS